MNEDERPVVVPLRRQWHVIRELDLIALVASHAEIRHHCTVLEGQADRLPADQDSLLTANCCASLATILRTLGDATDQMGHELFADERDGLTQTLLHQIGAGRTARLSDVEDLLAILHDPQHSLSADAVGYMMRGIFEGCRRMMLFEDVVLMLLAGGRLEEEARGVLVKSLLAACDAL